MKNKKTLKILAGFVAIMLIVGMLIITNAFIGNPYSEMLANKAIKQYVKLNYSFLDLEIEKANYDFKNSGYMAMATSKTSMDTKFAIYYSNGLVQRDDYQVFVLGKVNTLLRLSSEYSLVAKTIIANDLGFKNNTTYVIHDKSLSEKLSEDLELDMKFNKGVPINPEVTIQIDIRDYSLESVVMVLTKAHKAFLDNGCVFIKYNLYATNEEENIMVNGVTPTDIEGGELFSLLKKAEMKEAGEGITIYRKGEKK